MMGVLFAAATVARAEPVVITMYVNPQCDCCEGHAKHLQEHGFKVTMKPTHNMSLIKRQNGVPEKLDGCHTMLVGGYVVEGHVPVSAINMLLTERPKIKGISLPGMPEGSPGMSGRRTEPIHDLRDLGGRVEGVRGRVTRSPPAVCAPGQNVGSWHFCDIAIGRKHFR